MHPALSKHLHAISHDPINHTFPKTPAPKFLVAQVIVSRSLRTLLYEKTNLKIHYNHAAVPAYSKIATHSSKGFHSVALRLAANNITYYRHTTSGRPIRVFKWLLCTTVPGSYKEKGLLLGHSSSDRI